MTYFTWYTKHAQKHENIILKLIEQSLKKDEMIRYFDFDNMRKKEPDFCLLYKDNKKCHEMENLNCYMCACPHFYFSDKGLKELNGKVQYSYCAIDSKQGRLSVYGEAIHQDCSQCTVPHVESFISKHFNSSWKQMMKESILDNR